MNVVRQEAISQKRKIRRTHGNGKADETKFVRKGKEFVTLGSLSVGD